MKRVMRVVALTGMMALAAGSVAAAPAAAAAPQVVHTKVDVSLTDIHVCGFVDRFGNVSIQDLSHVVSTLTNQTNGKVVHVEAAGRDAFQPDPVVNPDRTITKTDTLSGMPVRIYTAHSNTLVKDVGFLSIVTTFDSQGNILNEQVIEHGPHPSGGPESAVFCAAIASAIG